MVDNTTEPKSEGEAVPDTIPGVQFDLPMIRTFVPECGAIKLRAYYPTMLDYYPFCEMQTKRWCVRNIKQDWQIFDVGGNIGYYAALFGRCAAQGHVVTFEPTETAKMLEQNLKLNGIENVEIRPVALGEQAGDLTEPVFRVWGHDPEVREFEFSTVDLEMSQLDWDRLDLLKIDVDSFDLEVLKGSVQTLRKFNPWILVELNHGLAERQQGVGEALDWLASQGYQDALVLDKENYLLRRSSTTDRTSSPTLCVRSEREPVFVGNTLKQLEVEGADLTGPHHQDIVHPGATETSFVLDAPAWSYGAHWSVTTQNTGPAVFSLEIETEGADVGVLCVGHDFSEIIGAESFVTPGASMVVRLEVERIEDVSALVIRKGPNMPSVASVRHGTPRADLAELANTFDLPMSINPSRNSVAFSEFATFLWADIASDTDAMLDIVNVHQLGPALDSDFAFRPPMLLVDTPLSAFRMETHDSHVLAQIYRMHAPNRHLEFGTREGFGTRLCLQNSDAHIWTVNLPEGEVDAKGNALYAAGSNIGRLYRNAGLAHRVDQILEDSLDFDASQYGEDFFDSILIDGGHTRPVVEADTENALRVIRPGGLVMWHDFCPDQRVLETQEASRGVVEAVLANWDRWRPHFSKIFWIRPSFILLGVANGAHSDADLN